MLWIKFSMGKMGLWRLSRGQTGRSSVSLGKLPSPMFSVLTALKTRGWRNVWNFSWFKKRTTFAFCLEFNSASVQKIVGPKFNDQPRLNCKLQIKIFLMEMKWTLKLKSGQAKGLFFDWSSIEAVQNQTKRVEKKSQKAFHLSFVCLAFTPCVL